MQGIWVLRYNYRGCVAIVCVVGIVCAVDFLRRLKRSATFVSSTFYMGTKSWMRSNVENIELEHIRHSIQWRLREKLKNKPSRLRTWIKDQPRINQGSRTPWTLDLQKTKSVFSFRNSVLSMVPFLFLKNEPHHISSWLNWNWNWISNFLIYLRHFFLFFTFHILSCHTLMSVICNWRL